MRLLLKLQMILATCLLPLAAVASIVSPVSVPADKTTGTTITASVWNSDVNGLYGYLNNTIVPAINKLTTKGDLFSTDGTNLTRLAAGTNGQALTCDSAETSGLKWANFANAAALTTKGDLLGFSTAAARVPIGADGTSLVADSTQALGFKWAAPSAAAPKGSIMAWSPAFAGTSTIPSGWLLCDGTSSTPNLIGRFILGTRPASSSATPSSGGYGAQTVDANGAGAAAHTHTISGSLTTSAPTAGTDYYASATSGAAGVALNGHYHTVTYSGTSSSVSTEPADYALVYIMKQ